MNMQFKHELTPLRPFLNCEARGFDVIVCKTVRTLKQASSPLILVIQHKYSKQHAASHQPCRPLLRSPLASI
jgi:hypothetical protein